MRFPTIQRKCRLTAASQDGIIRFNDMSAGVVPIKRMNSSVLYPCDGYYNVGNTAAAGIGIEYHYAMAIHSGEKLCPAIYTYSYTAVSARMALYAPNKYLFKPGMVIRDYGQQAIGATGLLKFADEIIPAGQWFLSIVFSGTAWTGMSMTGAGCSPRYGLNVAGWFVNPSSAYANGFSHNPSVSGVSPSSQLSIGVTL